MVRLSLILLALLLTVDVVVSDERDRIRELQSALFTLGFYYSASVDGSLGLRTTSAIKAFQQSVGAPPTGVPTENQIKHAVAEATQVSRPRAWPVDESDRDSAFLAVRNGLLEATRARDARGVASFFAMDAILDFGGSSGPDLLIARLSDRATGPALWEELETILEMGAIQTRTDTFCMPYVWCAERVLARIKADPMAWVVDRAAVLRATPDPESEVVELLRYDVFEIHGYQGEWARVTDNLGEDAWLHRSLYRTPYDFRILVKRQEGRWQVTAFLAGD